MSEWTQWVHEAYEAWNRGDTEAAFARLHPEVVFEQAQELPGGGGRYQGREGVMAAMEDLRSAFSEVRIEAERVIEAGDRIVALIVLRGKGKGSGAPFEVRAAQVFVVEGGMAIRWEAFFDREQALDSAGVPARDRLDSASR